MSSYLVAGLCVVLVVVIMLKLPASNKQVISNTVVGRNSTLIQSATAISTGNKVKGNMTTQVISGQATSIVNGVVCDGDFINSAESLSKTEEWNSRVKDTIKLLGAHADEVEADLIRSGPFTPSSECDRPKITADRLKKSLQFVLEHPEVVEAKMTEMGIHQAPRLDPEIVFKFISEAKTPLDISNLAALTKCGYDPIYEALGKLGNRVEKFTVDYQFDGFSGTRKVWRVTS